jgi:transcriptional regulator with XRE-family HTH domain
MANTPNELLCENLIYYRKAAGYTQLEIAEKFNYSDKLISKWERGEGVPDVFVLKKLADLYGIAIDDFFNGKKRKLSSKRAKRRYIVGLGIALVWLVAALGFTVCMLIMGDDNIFEWWLFYIYAIVGSGVVGIVFSSIYKKNLLQLISISTVVWSGVLSGFLTAQFTVPNIKYHYFLFIIGGVLQVLAILWFFFRNSMKKKAPIKENQ